MGKGFTIINVDIGDAVLCDLCNGDFSESEETGGFIFGSKAVCPRCAPALEEDIIKFEEGAYIRRRCKETESFKEMVLQYRETHE